MAIKSHQICNISAKHANNFSLCIKKSFPFSLRFLMITLMETNSSLEVVSCKPQNETKEKVLPLFYSFNIIFAHIILYTKPQPHTIKNILERIKIKLVISKRHQTMIANKYGKNWLDGDEEIKDLDCNKREQKENRESWYGL